MSTSNLKRVAIIGRPNVGKSTLFNRLTRSRLAVVKNQPGVTRDIQVEPCEWWGKSFEIVDTGGITGDKAGFSPLIRKQVIEYLKTVDMNILILDGRQGLMPEDRDALVIAKRSGKPLLVVVNKCDKTLDAEGYLSDFMSLGVDMIPAAFERDFNIDLLVEWIISNLDPGEAKGREGFRLAIVGKPNAGKSSLANCLLGEHRVLVSPTAGTTVDAIEAEFKFNDKEYILIDTAGLRRAAKQHDGVEVLSTFKTRHSIFKADLVLLVIDATVGPSNQDSRIIELCLEHHKAILVVASKMDLAKETHDTPREWFRDRVAREFHFFTDVPVVFTSSMTGAGMDQLFDKIEDMREKLARRISTSKLNKFFTEVIKKAPSPVYGTKDVKFYYLTQTNQSPPSFIAFANHPDGVTPAYRRFLIRKIQEQWDLKGIPLRVFVMEKGGG
jgi:GTP-binding protein